MDNKSDGYWRSHLTDDEYRICRGKGTEPAFSGIYNDQKAEGSYLCKCCNETLFCSGHKYNSGSGWPSFYAANSEAVIDEHRDVSHGMSRVEVTCHHCGCHLGHLFEDGPEPSGLRYCVNSASLTFQAK